MCGRFVLDVTPDDVARMFDVEGFAPFPPRYNIAPGQPIAVVREEHGRRRLELVRWGLVPGWVKDPSAFSKPINARSETVLEKPTFRGAMRHRRCLIPASGFYEWARQAGGSRQPFLIRPTAGGVVGLAGLWEEWVDPDGGIHETGVILTTAANAMMSAIHDRMPAVIPPDSFAAWLDCRHVDGREAAGLVRPVHDDFFTAVAVDTRVNAVKNDDAGLTTPAGPVPAPRGAAEEDDRQPRLL